MPRIHFITQGCSANVADSEIMQGLLVQAGHTIIDCLDDADLVVYNTCTVKGPTQSKFLRVLKKLKEKKLPVVIAGCIPQSDKSMKELSDCSVVGTYDIDQIVSAVNSTLQGKKVTFLSVKNKPRLCLPKIRTNPLIEIIPISHGCLGACTYCKTKQARGHLHSFSIDDILRHAAKAVSKGARELWITSQDNSAYGLDIDKSLPELIKKIVQIPGDFMVRIGMSNPEHILPVLSDLIGVYKSEKVYKFLHVPLQSGSNKVLRDMNRKYKAEDYLRIIRDFKKHIPSITIATDVICAFPTETDEDFEKTKYVIRKSEPVVMNIARFWPRPGTPAQKLKLLSGKVMKERTQQMTKLHKELTKKLNNDWIGWSGKILVTEKGKNNSWVGRNYAYKQVVIKSDKNLLGRDLHVKIVDTGIFDLRAKILNTDVM